MDPARPEVPARKASQPSFWAKSLMVGMAVALLPNVLVSFVVRRLRGAQKDLPFLEDLRRSAIRGVTLLPIRVLLARRPPLDVEALISAPRLKNYDRQLCLPVSDGLCNGFWICRGPPGSSQHPRESDIVLMYIHGGAYCFGEPLGSTLLLLRAAEIAAAARSVSVSIFTVAYTLAPAGGTFPLQQCQAVAAYRHLLDVERIPSEKIVIGGESAGSHLALTCLLGVAEARLPKPAGALFLFPWISLKNESPSFERNKHKDVLTKSLLDRCADLVIGPNNGKPGAGVQEGIDWDQLELVDLNLPLGPGRGNWKQILPSFTWMNVGEHDMFFDDIVAFRKTAEADGARMEVNVTPKKPHGWHAEDRPMANTLLQMSPDETFPSEKLPGCENVGNGLITVWDEMRKG
ncbi:hypothetical protein SEUCBS140593_003965 [Sporothrix eucalyptigena]|uniref:Alpha/beta hydrolase fold-3 domain-containing protein n=1 Tax=Sporothrix eucalyptigena TaxID=1812306 RepID=A0ABP0BJG6_9PEZI